MRSNRGIFWYSLGLTLLLLLPMVLTVAFFTDQYQKQQLLRQASAADSTLHIEPGAQGVYTLLLVVQQEEPAFVLARADGPQQTVTLCALPGSLRVSAPSGTTTLAECALSAGAGRAAQLLVGTVATGETAAPALHYIAATPATWADCAGRTASARIDTASLLDAATRTRLGYGEDPIAVCTAAQATELIAQLQAALPGAGEGCMARAAVWAAFLRQDPALLAGLPDGLRSRSARLLTDLLAADLNALGETLAYLSARTALTIDYTTAAVAAAVWAAFLRQDPALLAGLPDGLRSRSARLLTDLLAADLNALGETLTYLSARTALTIDYTTAAVAAARGGVQLTEEGMAAVCALLL